MSNEATPDLIATTTLAQVHMLLSSISIDLLKIANTEDGSEARELTDKSIRHLQSAVHVMNSFKSQAFPG